jgi:hypothetical protein
VMRTLVANSSCSNGGYYTVKRKSNQQLEEVK